jgi:hypothetical protein
VIQAKNGPPLTISGVVDSGAFTCCLPLEDAKDLGIPDSALHEAGEIVLADDRTVVYLQSSLAIRAQVQTQASAAAPGQPWGPIFELYPAFMPEGSRLLGQRDFFNSFEITFQRYLTEPTFALRYWEGMSPTPR